MARSTCATGNPEFPDEVAAVVPYRLDPEIVRETRQQPVHPATEQRPDAVARLVETGQPALDQLAEGAAMVLPTRAGTRRMQLHPWSGHCPANRRSRCDAR